MLYNAFRIHIGRGTILRAVDTSGAGFDVLHDRKVKRVRWENKSGHIVVPICLDYACHDGNDLHTHWSQFHTQCVAEHGYGGFGGVVDD